MTIVFWVRRCPRRVSGWGSWSAHDRTGEASGTRHAMQETGRNRVDACSPRPSLREGRATPRRRRALATGINPVAQ